MSFTAFLEEPDDEQAKRQLIRSSRARLGEIRTELTALRKEERRLRDIVRALEAQ